jgi:hypothetical protein
VAGVAVATPFQAAVPITLTSRKETAFSLALFTNARFLDRMAQKRDFVKVWYVNWQNRARFLTIALSRFAFRSASTPPEHALEWGILTLW